MGTPLLCSKGMSRWTGACGGWAPPQGKLAQGGAVGRGRPQPPAWWMGPSHMWRGGECRFSGGVPLPIFALWGTGRAHEYSAEATDLAQLFPTYTESAVKTSSAGAAQPSPADSGRTEPPPTHPSALEPPESSLPALPAQPGPSLSGASTRHPLDLPTSSHCLTQPAPPPADSPPSPSQPCSDLAPHVHVP